MKKWFIRKKCKWFGHIWDNGNYKQQCTRKGCVVYRTIMYKEHHKIGENPYSWKIIDFDSIKLP